MAVAAFGDVEGSLSWEAVRLVMSERHFFVASAALVKYRSKAGARNVVIFTRKCISGLRQVSSTNRRVRDNQFMLGSWNVILRGRRNI